MRLVVSALITCSVAGCASPSETAGSVPGRVLPTTERAGGDDARAADAPAACAAPRASVAPRRSGPGGLLLLSGKGFTASCNDTGQDRAGAARDVPVTLEQGRREWDLGTADASADSYALRLTAAVPVDAEPGKAQVRVGPAPPVRLSIVEEHIRPGAPAVSATWVSPDTVALMTAGSSSCPTRWADMEHLAAQTVQVRAGPSGPDVCTTDLVPSTQQVTLPHGVSLMAPCTLVVHLDMWRSERLTLQPPRLGR